MIPDNDMNYENYEDDDEDEDIAEEFEISAGPSLTYAMNPERNIFVGKADDAEAVQQAVLKILNTERYEHEIYSWDYGVEFADLYGAPMPYAMSEVKQRITEALLRDDRIESVDGFAIELSGKRSLHVAFTVSTKQGDEFESEREVVV